MRVLTSAWTHLVVALALGAGAAALVVDRLDEPPPAMPPLGDRAAALAAGLEDDPVQVTPDARGWISEEDEAALEEEIESRGLALRVVVTQSTESAGYEAFRSAGLDEQLLATIDEPVALVLWQGPDDSSVRTSPGWRFASPPYDADWTDAPTFLGDAGDDLRAWVEPLPDDVLTPREPQDSYGGIGGGLTFALLVGGLVVGGVWVAAGIVRAVTGRPFVVPRRARRSPGRSRARPRA